MIGGYRGISCDAVAVAGDEQRGTPDDDELTVGHGVLVFERGEQREHRVRVIAMQRVCGRVVERSVAAEAPLFDEPSIPSSWITRA